MDTARKLGKPSTKSSEGKSIEIKVDRTKPETTRKEENPKAGPAMLGTKFRFAPWTAMRRLFFLRTSKQSLISPIACTAYI